VRDPERAISGVRAYYDGPGALGKQANSCDDSC
jgi:hypothetical protein